MLRAAAASGASAAGVAAAAQQTPTGQQSPTSQQSPAAHQPPAGQQHSSAQDQAHRAAGNDDRRRTDNDRRRTGAGAAAAAATAGSAGSARSHAATASASAPNTNAAADDAQSGDESPATRGPARARRHSSRLGEGFPSLVGWTSLSTLLPGVGLLRTKFRPLGLIVFGGFVLTILIAIGYLLIKGPVHAVATIIATPTLLNVLAIGAVLVGLIWIVVIVISHLGLRKGHRYAPWQNRMSGLLVVSLVLIIGIPFGIGSVYARVQADTIASLFGASTGRTLDAQELWKDKPFINVFLIGRDNGDDRTGTRPDTMLVASIDTKTGNAALISVPRNLAFPIFPADSPEAQAWPDGFRPTGDSSVDLINAVWQWGEENPDAVGETNGLEPGMTATMAAVEGSLGLNLDYWASVDMAGFEDVVDAIGGVNIDVERPIPMGGGKSMSGVPNKVFGWIDPGPQNLKGKKALWYVRSREGSDNYDRMCRQQRMLKTTLEQIDPQELAAAYPKLAGSATKNIATSIPQNEIPAFIELAVAMQKGDVTTVQINNDVTPTYDPDFDVLHQWIQGEIQGASDGAETPQPTNDPSQNNGSDAGEDTTDSGTTDDSQDTETGTEAPAGDDATAEPTPETVPGEPNAAGMCYPQDYQPGDPWPGYPGPGAGTQE
ncbi:MULTISPECIES: LCP family glycopolymer transferase [Brevibacterium]|uniref:LCP family glycopolymer transferase n=1 Tax=Brevibacterium sanguinis TaxID=232444 RepID=UPI0031E1A085